MSKRYDDTGLILDYLESINGKLYSITCQLDELIKATQQHKPLEEAVCTPEELFPSHEE